MFLEFSIILPALVAGILILAIHVPLGIEIMRRGGVVFIDLPIAQLAAMGAFFAMILFHDLENTIAFFLVVQVSGFLCAAMGALLLMYIGKFHRGVQEASIGCIFVLSATLVLIVLGKSSCVYAHIDDLLAGQILFVTWHKVGVIAIMAALCGFMMYRFRTLVLDKYFYLFIAFFVTASVQIAGIYLVFATLMIPGVGVYYFAKYQHKLLWGYLGSFVGLIIGILASLFFDLSTGPTIVWGIGVSMLVIFCVAAKNTTIAPK